MVSLWPFKGEDNSPASFEKALSTLSAKITRATARLDLHRQHARRFKALWMLYTSFIYLIYSIILAFVPGWQNWGLSQYAAITGGPLVIYVVRAGATKYFDFRIEKTQRYLEDLQKQRDETIEKLKVATKYDSTQQLLEKYAGESPKPQQPRTKGSNTDEKRKVETNRKPSASQQQPPVQRTGLPPPPTANIRRPPPEEHPEMLPHQSPPSYQTSQNQPHSLPSSPAPPAIDEPGFAPNAFPAPPQYIEQSRWYDRLLDVLLGEDETQPKNRIALICSTCRLVNGQAPPGVKSLEDLGRWRCGSCGAWNGEESVAKKVLAGIQKKPQRPVEGTWEPVAESDTENRSSVGEGTDEAVMVPSEDDQLESHSSGAETPNEDEVSPGTEEEDQPKPKRISTRSQTRGRRGRKA